MALIISEIIEGDVNFQGDFTLGIEFKMDFKKDGFILQDIVRALVTVNGSFEANFGIGSDFKEVLEFDYACKGAVNRLIFERSNGGSTYKHMVIKKAPKKKEIRI